MHWTQKKKKIILFLALILQLSSWPADSNDHHNSYSLLSTYHVRGTLGTWILPMSCEAAFWVPVCAHNSPPYGNTPHFVLRKCPPPFHMTLVELSIKRPRPTLRERKGSEQNMGLSPSQSGYSSWEPDLSGDRLGLRAGALGWIPELALPKTCWLTLSCISWAIQ